VFFYVSKILWFCLQRSSLLLVLTLVGAVLIARYQTAGRRLVLASAMLLLLGRLLPLSTWLILPLGQRFSRADVERQHFYIAVDKENWRASSRSS
jgi:hypothetical protein